MFSNSPFRAEPSESHKRTIANLNKIKDAISGKRLLHVNIETVGDYIITGKAHADTNTAKQFAHDMLRRTGVKLTYVSREGKVCTYKTDWEPQEVEFSVE